MRSLRLLFSLQSSAFPPDPYSFYRLALVSFFDVKMPAQALQELPRPACWSASATRGAELGLPIWPRLQARL